MRITRTIETMTHWKIALQKLLSDLLCCNSPKIQFLLKPNEYLHTFDLCGYRNKSDLSLNYLTHKCSLCLCLSVCHKEHTLLSSHISFRFLLHSFGTTKSLWNIFMQLINELAIFVCYSAWATKHIEQCMFQTNMLIYRKQYETLVIIMHYKRNTFCVEKSPNWISNTHIPCMRVRVCNFYVKFLWMRARIHNAHLHPKEIYISIFEILLALVKLAII